MGDEVIFRAVAGSLKGEEFVFDEKGLCLIGRSNDCALQIPKENDMRISRRHCLIILDPPNVRVRDLNSRNGTFVNDVKLEPGAIGDNPSEPTSVDVVLNDGDVLSLGETVLEFEIPSRKSDAPVVKKQPPQGTKVIKLAKPAKTHTGTLIPKAAAVDTGFFKPPSAAKGNEKDATAPLTELFAKPALGVPVNAYEYKKRSEADSEEETVAAPPVDAPGSTKKPLKLADAAQKGEANILGSPSKKKPVSLVARKPAAPVREQSAPPANAGAPIRLTRGAVVQEQGESGESTSVPSAPAPPEQPVAAPPKKPIILNRNAASQEATKPPMKAKKKKKKRADTDLTEVMDISALDDDMELGADYIRKENKKKRVTKFKIKAPK